MDSSSTDSAIQRYLAQVRGKRLARPGQCPTCKQAGRLRWHGQYKRSLIVFHRVWVLPIRRLLCAACRHTFALLPSFIVKWRRYARNVIKTALRWLKVRTFETVTDLLSQECEREVAPLTLYWWRKRLSPMLLP